LVSLNQIIQPHGGYNDLFQLPGQNTTLVSHHLGIHGGDGQGILHLLTGHRR
jgi:hypothetical protein